MEVKMMLIKQENLVPYKTKKEIIKIKGDIINKKILLIIINKEIILIIIKMITEVKITIEMMVKQTK